MVVKWGFGFMTYRRVEESWPLSKLLHKLVEKWSQLLNGTTKIFQF